MAAINHAVSRFFTSNVRAGILETFVSAKGFMQFMFVFSRFLLRIFGYFFG